MKQYFIILFLTCTILCNASEEMTSQRKINEWKKYLREFPLPIITDNNNGITYKQPYENWRNDDTRWEKILPIQASCLQHSPSTLFVNAQGNIDSDLDEAIKSGLSQNDLEPIITDATNRISNIDLLVHAQAMLIRHQVHAKTYVSRDWDTLTNTATSKTKHPIVDQKPVTLEHLISIIENRITRIQDSQKKLKQHPPSEFLLEDEEDYIGIQTTENALPLAQRLLYQLTNPRTMLLKQKNDSSEVFAEENTITTTQIVLTDADIQRSKDNIPLSKNNDYECLDDDDLQDTTSANLAHTEAQVKEIHENRQHTEQFKRGLQLQQAVTRVKHEIFEWVNAAATLFGAVGHSGEQCSGWMDTAVKANISEE